MTGHIGRMAGRIPNDVIKKYAIFLPAPCSIALVGIYHRIRKRRYRGSPLPYYAHSGGPGDGCSCAEIGLGGTFSQEAIVDTPPKWRRERYDKLEWD